MVVAIGNRSPEDRGIACRYCGSITWLFVCEPCDTRNLFSDLYKDENGIRPRFEITLRQMRQWIVDWDLRHPTDSSDPRSFGGEE